VSSDPRRELARLADGDDPGSASARAALSATSTAARLRAAILALAQHRGPNSSICPSDAARAVGGSGWRALTAQSRSIAYALARDGDVDITQRGAVLDPDREARGPVRIRVRGAGDQV
jgi:hypothetical protein